MTSEIGELFVGAYLRKVLGCPIVQYNLRDSAAAIASSDGEPLSPKSQGEIDVLALDYRNKRLFACEVVTHLGGALYPATKSGKDETVDRLARKLARHREMVSRDFSDVGAATFMIWSPYVAAGVKTEGLRRLAAEWPQEAGSLELMINDDYTAAMLKLLDLAARDDGHTEEPFYRMCQLLTHLRTANNRRARVHID